MTLLQRLASYLFPIIRRIPSEHSGYLEVTLSNGRKVLDSSNANYSYGSLQRILRFGLSKIPLKASDHVLLLGLGGGSVVATLRQEFQFAGHITAVDIDPAVIQIARQEFGIVPAPNLRIACADAFDFVKTQPETHAVIIVDLFIDNRVPDPFLSAEFWQHIADKTAPGGWVIFNAIAGLTDAARVHRQLRNLGFAVQEHTRVEGTNTLLLAQRP